MPDYQLRIFKPMETMARGWSLVQRIDVVAEDDESAIAQAYELRPEDFTGDDSGILFSGDEAKHWIIDARVV